MQKRTSALAVVAIAIAATFAGVRWLPAQEQNPPVHELPAVLKVKALVAKEGDDEFRKLRIARYNAALSEARSRFLPERGTGYSIGATDQAVVRLFQAELALADTMPKRVRACENYLEAAKHLEEFVSNYVQAGVKGATKADIEACRYVRIDAEIRLAETKAGLK